jgi:cytosine deaminase
MALVLRGGRLADGVDRDVRIEGQRIAAVGSVDIADGDTVVDVSGMLVLPALAEPHAHLDKAFLAEVIDNPTGDLMGAIIAMTANRHRLTVADTIERAERAVRLMVRNGTTAIRSHADTTMDHGLKSIEALVEVRDRVADICDVQVVALTGWPVTGAAGADHRALLRDAIAAGADVVGGCPHLEDDPNEATEEFMTIAAEHGLAVDLHTDETLDPTKLALRTLAHHVTHTGFPHSVTASHCVSLGVQDGRIQDEVAECVAAAQVSVVALPQTNLYLQGRDTHVSTPRGLTALRALRRAGANVAAGADNLQDPFNLVGKGDPLETAALMVMAGHYLPADAFESVTAAARRAMALEPITVEPGAPADLVAIPAGSVREAVAFQPHGRIVVRRGAVIEQ